MSNKPPLELSDLGDSSEMTVQQKAAATNADKMVNDFRRSIQGIVDGMPNQDHKESVRAALIGMLTTIALHSYDQGYNDAWELQGENNG